MMEMKMITKLNTNMKTKTGYVIDHDSKTKNNIIGGEIKNKDNTSTTHTIINKHKGTR